MKHVEKLRRSDRLTRIVAAINTHKKQLLIALGAVVGVVVIVQLLYPQDRTLPFARIGGESAGGQSRQFVALALRQSFSDYVVVYQAGGSSLERSISELGATLDADAMLSRAVDYPLLYRLIPFSMLWYRTMPNDFQLEWSDTVLEEASTKIADELSVSPTDASITIKASGETEITSADEGILVSADTVTSRTLESAFPIGDAKKTVDVQSETQQPVVKDEDVRTIKQTIESILDTELQIAIEDRAVVKPTKFDVAKWISVAKTDDGMVKLEADEDAIASYISGLSKEFGTPPTQTVVSLVDGVEKSRKNGVAGLGVDAADLTTKLAAIVTTPSASDELFVTAQFAPIPSPIKREATYTSSIAGLRAYVDDITRDGSIKVSVRQLGGNGWSAGGGASDSVVAASTYKPYVLLRVFDDINTGKLRWNDTIEGMTYAKCLEDTIVISSNECPMALIEKYDKFKLTDYVRSKGFSSGTGFVFKEATQTTAGDLTKLMAGIEQGSLVKNDNRQRLLSAMSRQIYRQGIPAGTNAPVYNKVGFLWDYLNDAAIVRHPQGTYVLAIMTKGQTWGKIADITRELERIMYG